MCCKHTPDHHYLNTCILVNPLPAYTHANLTPPPCSKYLARNIALDRLLKDYREDWPGGGSGGGSSSPSCSSGDDKDRDSYDQLGSADLDMEDEEVETQVRHMHVDCSCCCVWLCVCVLPG